MKNYGHLGNTITLTAPNAVASGDGLFVGPIFGVAAGNVEVADASVTRDAHPAKIGGPC